VRPAATPSIALRGFPNDGALCQILQAAADVGHLLRAVFTDTPFRDFNELKILEAGGLGLRVAGFPTAAKTVRIVAILSTIIRT
jgi:hypothetical protein